MSEVKIRTIRPMRELNRVTLPMNIVKDMGLKVGDNLVIEYHSDSKVITLTPEVIENDASTDDGNI